MVNDSLTLHRIASALRKRRFDGGALRLDNTRLFFKLDGEGNPCDYGVYEQARPCLLGALLVAPAVAPAGTRMGRCCAPVSGRWFPMLTAPGGPQLVTAVHGSLNCCSSHGITSNALHCHQHYLSYLPQKEANQLVEEFMLLANMTTARMVAEAWPDR